MSHYSTDRCTVCRQITSPELLTIKRISFAPRTNARKVTRSRTVAWLCGKCLLGDEHYNLPAYKGAPGMTSEALERVRNGTVGE